MKDANLELYRSFRFSGTYAVRNGLIASIDPVRTDNFGTLHQRITVRNVHTDDVVRIIPFKTTAPVEKIEFIGESDMLIETTMDLLIVNEKGMFKLMYSLQQPCFEHVFYLGVIDNRVAVAVTSNGEFVLFENGDYVVAQRHEVDDPRKIYGVRCIAFLSRRCLLFAERDELMRECIRIVEIADGNIFSTLVMSDASVVDMCAGSDNTVFVMHRQRRSTILTILHYSDYAEDCIRQCSFRLRLQYEDGCISLIPMGSSACVGLVLRNKEMHILDTRTRQMTLACEKYVDTRGYPYSIKYDRGFVYMQDSIEPRAYRVSAPEDLISEPSMPADLLQIYGDGVVTSFARRQRVYMGKITHVSKLKKKRAANTLMVSIGSHAGFKSRGRQFKFRSSDQIEEIRRVFGAMVEESPGRKFDVFQTEMIRRKNEAGRVAMPPFMMQMIKYYTLK